MTFDKEFVKSKLTEIKENVEFNLDDIKDDADMADELITFDLLSVLGYDRKKDKTVKRVAYDNSHIWVITTDGNCDTKNLVFKTIKYGEEPNIEECKTLHDKYKCAIIISNNTKLFIMSSKCDEVLSELDFDAIPEHWEFIADRNNLAQNILNIESENLHNLKVKIIEGIRNCSDNEFISTEFCEKNNFDKSLVASVITEIITDGMTNYGEVGQNVAPVESIDTSEFEKTINGLKDENTSLKNRLEELSSELTETTKVSEYYKEKADSLAEELKAAETKQATVEQETVETDEETPVEEPVEADEVVPEQEPEIAETQEIEEKQEVETAETQEVVEEAPVEEVKSLDDMRANAELILKDIEDNGTRTYAGVVNDILFQTTNINDFVENAVHELYTVMGTKALSRIFDGDIFVVSANDTGKCIIANKRYTINLDGMTDEQVFDKLNILFGYFEDVVFIYKAYNNTVEETGNAEEFIDVADVVDEADNGISVSDAVANNGKKQTDDLSDLDMEDDLFGDFTSSPGKEANLTKMSLMDIINAIGRLSSGIDYSMMKVVEYNGKQFSIASENNSMFDNSLYKLCMAIIAYSKQKYETTATTISKIEFSKISKAVDYVSDEMKFIGDGTLRFAIPGTHYALRELDVKFFIPIVNTICDLIDVDEHQIYVYMELNATDTELITAGISTDKYAIDYTLDNNYIYDSDDSDEFNTVVFSGNILGLSINTGLDTSVMENIIKNCLAIKTGSNLNCKINDPDDLAYVITEILAVSKVPVETAIKIVDAAIDIVTENNSDDSVELNIKGDTHYYLNNVTPAQYCLATLFLYGIAMGNISAGILTKVNRSALEYYKEFNTNDPVKYVEAKACAEYALARIK